MIDTVAEDDLEMPEEFRGCRVVEQTLPDGKVQVFYRGVDGLNISEDAASVLIDAYREELATVRPKTARPGPREGYSALQAPVAVEPRLVGPQAATAVLTEEVIDTLGFGDDLPPELRGASFVRRGGEFRYVTRDGTRLSKDMAEGIMERWDRDQHSRQAAPLPAPISPAAPVPAPFSPAAIPTSRWGASGSASVPSGPSVPAFGRVPSVTTTLPSLPTVPQPMVISAPVPLARVSQAAPATPFGTQASRSPATPAPTARFTDAAPATPFGTQASRSPATPAPTARFTDAAPATPFGGQASRSPAQRAFEAAGSAEEQPSDGIDPWSADQPPFPARSGAHPLADATLETALDTPAVAGARHAAERLRSLVIGGSAAVERFDLSQERLQQSCLQEIERKRTKHRFEALVQLSEQARGVLIAAWDTSRDRVTKEAARDLEQGMLVLGLVNPMTLQDIDLAELISVVRLRHSDRRRDTFTRELARRITEEVPPALLQFLMTRAFVERVAEVAASTGSAEEALRQVIAGRLTEALDAVTSEVMRRHGVFLPGMNERILGRLGSMVDGLFSLLG